MIYGLNFTRTPIPAAAKSLFAKRRRFDTVTVGDLVGVCQGRDERDAMLIQADNGHRILRVVERGAWIAVYSCWLQPQRKSTKKVVTRG